MSETADAFLALVSGRRGHFRLESGHHGELWLDLDGLFAQPVRVAPLVARLVEALRPYGVAGVCGPLVGGAFLAQSVASMLEVEFCYTERAPSPARAGLYQARYRLPAAFSSRVQGKQIAIVDDVMSAGSAVRATDAELRAHGAQPVVVGALLLLGAAGADFFQRDGLAVEAVARLPYSLWSPGECPLCAAGVALQRPGELDAGAHAPME
ncbi:MAG: phosphoribosyltransferase family protein [Gemmatimonadales bacterium]